MTGLAMMLKAVGVDIDPAALSKWIADAQVAVPQFINHGRVMLAQMDARLSAIEAEQKVQRELLEQILEALHAGRDRTASSTSGARRISA